MLSMIPPAASSSSRAAAAAAAAAATARRIRHISAVRRRVTSAAGVAAPPAVGAAVVRTTARLSVPTFAPPCPDGDGGGGDIGGIIGRRRRRRRQHSGVGGLVEFGVPLSVVDVSLRSEQLPFAYFFASHLDDDLLISSLGRVLRHFPLLGGRVELGRGRSPRIVCAEGDSVDLYLGTSDVPLGDWLDGGEGCDKLRRHVNCSNGGHPALLPLFEPLFAPSDHLDPLAGDGGTLEDGEGASGGRLATVRVTHLAGGGTAVGVNMSHALADAASAVRFVRCWGREMRSKPYPPGGGACPSNDRSRATTGGMVSPELSDLMGLGLEEGGGENDGGIAMPDFGMAGYYDRAVDLRDELRASLLWQVQPWDDGRLGGHRSAPLFETFREAERQLCEEENIVEQSAGIEHEYVHLPFSPEVLGAMKAHGMEECRRRRCAAATGAAAADADGFVSTNDMVTAFGWLLKRRLSGRADWGVSMVVDLRGRDGCHVDDFACMDTINGGGGDAKGGNDGVFGNGIANVVAAMPPTAPAMAAVDEGSDSSDDRHDAGGGSGDREDGEGDASIVEISAAARAVRRALTTGFLDMPDRVAASRIGRPSSGAAESDVGGGGGSFGTTSWGRFPLWDVRFSSPPSTTPDDGDDDGGRLVGFHGHPSHPLPAGRRTYSSVLVPRADGGVTYKLLLPGAQSAEAEAAHGRACASFLAWHDAFRRSAKGNDAIQGPGA